MAPTECCAIAVVRRRERRTQLPTFPPTHLSGPSLLRLRLSRVFRVSGFFVFFFFSLDRGERDEKREGVEGGVKVDEGRGEGRGGGQTRRRNDLFPIDSLVYVSIFSKAKTKTYEPEKIAIPRILFSLNFQELPDPR